VIRLLTADDVSAMAELHKAGISPFWPKSDMLDHVTRDICLGAGTPLTGLIILRSAADQAEVLTIVTDPKQRQSGIGKALLLAAEKKAAQKGIEVIFLEVADDNIAAIALYKSSGFEPLGKRPAYYRREGGRVAALTYRKRLDA